MLDPLAILVFEQTVNCDARNVDAIHTLRLRVDVVASPIGVNVLIDNLLGDNLIDVESSVMFDSLQHFS
jgi:hypothetical protein